MDLIFSEEHEDLRRIVRQFLDDVSSEQATRELMETERGYDPEVWKRAAEQMGLPGLVIPEEFGGAGYGFVELTVVLEEMGRALYCGPYLSTAVLAAHALLLASATETQAELLPRIASGEALATLAHAEENDRWDLAGIETRAKPDGAGWRLEGAKTWVLDGHSADVILVAARSDEGLGLFRVDAGAEGLVRTALPGLDLTRKLARLELGGVPAVRVDGSGDASEVLERVLALGVTALAAAQAGGAQRCLDMATEYARTRLQFGRPIGSFQAIKHRCADMLVEVEFAKSAAYHAGFTAASGEGDLLAAASLAKSYCSEAYFHAAAENIQIHGGMGFTWEHPAHLYFKRAKSSELLFGDPVYHRERVAERIGLGTFLP